MTDPRTITRHMLDTANVVIIIGPPDGGKSYLTDQLALEYPDHKVYHTDDYISWGWDQAIDAIIFDIERDNAEKIIVEGVQGYRLLRKWAENPQYNKRADLVIVAEREPKPENKRASEHMQKGLDTTWSDWHQKKDYEPKIIYVDEQGTHTKGKRYR